MRGLCPLMMVGKAVSPEKLFDFFDYDHVRAFYNGSMAIQRKAQEALASMATILYGVSDIVAADKMRSRS